MRHPPGRHQAARAGGSVQRIWNLGTNHSAGAGAAGTGRLPGNCAEKTSHRDLRLCLTGGQGAAKHEAGGGCAGKRSDANGQPALLSDLFTGIAPVRQ